MERIYEKSEEKALSQDCVCCALGAAERLGRVSWKEEEEKVQKMTGGWSTQGLVRRLPFILHEQGTMQDLEVQCGILWLTV